MPVPAFFGEALSFSYTDQTVSVTLSDKASGRSVPKCLIVLPLPTAKILSVALRGIITGLEAQQGTVWINPELWEQLGALGVAPDDWPTPLNIPDLDDNPPVIPPGPESNE